MSEPLIRKVDGVQVIVPDLEAGLAFYRDKLGHELRWRNETSAGLSMPDGEAELVIQTKLGKQETDLPRVHSPGSSDEARMPSSSTRTC
jgi:catechol 2,3-dioxygenase-like lactoylglutathione lyase family enzyme